MQREYILSNLLPKDIFESFGSGQQWTTITGKLFYVLTLQKRCCQMRLIKVVKSKNI